MTQLSCELYAMNSLFSKLSRYLQVCFLRCSREFTELGRHCGHIEEDCAGFGGRNYSTQSTATCWNNLEVARTKSVIEYGDRKQRRIVWAVLGVKAVVTYMKPT